MTVLFNMKAQYEGILLLAKYCTDIASLREAWGEANPRPKDNNCLFLPTASFISPCNLSSIAKASVGSRISNFYRRANSKSYNHIQQAEKAMQQVLL